MKNIKWDDLKNRKLKSTRGASFEEILSSKFIGLFEHPGRKHQFLLLYEYESMSGLSLALLKRKAYF